MSINSDSDVMEVMEMVLGDYLAVYTEGLEDQLSDGDITPEEQLTRSIQFSRGCRKICKAFGLDIEVLDVDHLVASETMCDLIKEDALVGLKDQC